MLIFDVLPVIDEPANAYQKTLSNSVGKYQPSEF